jgi:hypothetical protein
MADNAQSKGQRRPRRRAFEPHATARHDDGNAFLPDPQQTGEPPRSDEELAETRGEELVESATSGQDPDEQELDGDSADDELGGPFVETTAAEEMASGTDASNPPDATREPLPRAVAGTVSEPDEETLDETTDEDGEGDDRDEMVRPRNPDPGGRP